MKQIHVLSVIANQYLQAAYSAFVSGFKHKLNYVLRIIPSIEEDLRPIDHSIRTKLIPAFCDERSCNDTERKLFSLQVKCGGLGIDNFTKNANFEFETSKNVTAKLANEIKYQNDTKFTCNEQ